jgi:hypothetical protein
MRRAVGVDVGQVTDRRRGGEQPVDVVGLRCPGVVDGQEPLGHPAVETAVLIEQTLALEPGHLTVHLGFLPIAGGTVEIRSPEEAVIADATLSGRDKRLVLDLLARVRGEPR